MTKALSRQLSFICTFVFGSRYDINDPELHRVLKYTDQFAQGLRAGNLVDYFPWMRFFPNKGEIIDTIQFGISVGICAFSPTRLVHNVYSSTKGACIKTSAQKQRAKIRILSSKNRLE